MRLQRSGTFEAFEKRAEEYQQNLAGILPDLPPEVRHLATDISLHDGLLWKIEANPKQASLRLALRCGDLQVGYFDLELEYQQVAFSAELIGELAKLTAIPLDHKRPSYQSEALYDEVDLEGELLAHRILFWHNDWAQRRLLWRKRRSGRPKRRRVLARRSNYREIIIRFKQLRIRTTSRASRYAVQGR